MINEHNEIQKYQYNKELDEYVIKFINNYYLIDKKYFIPSSVLRRNFIDFLIQNHIEDEIIRNFKYGPYIDPFFNEKIC